MQIFFMLLIDSDNITEAMQNFPSEFLCSIFHLGKRPSQIKFICFSYPSFWKELYKYLLKSNAMK